MKLFDGCTFSPDLWFRDCCEEHDLYYKTGTDRRHADNELKMCIYKKTRCKLLREGVDPDDAHAWAWELAMTYYWGVRIFGWIFWARSHQEWQRMKERICKR